VIETREAPPAELVFDVHPGVSYVQAMLANFPAKTGKTIEEWVALVEGQGPAAPKERHAWLKTVHKLGNTYAGMVVERAAGRGTFEADPEGYLRDAWQFVEAMFAGPKAHLRPIFEELVRLGRALGPDVKVCPCQTIVPLYRAHVFAEIKPTTRTRVDLGFALKDQPLSGRLQDTGGFAKGDRITRRIPIASLAEIDDEVIRWLRLAYELDT
jgi:Domain of unknown function (DUF5655)/Domain of unknown function (DUF4287)